MFRRIRRRGGGAGEGAGGKDEEVLGAEGVGVGLQSVVEDLDAEAASAEKGLRERHV